MNILPSVLQVSSEHTKNLLAFHWNDNLTEMREHIPDILDFMAAVDIVLKLMANGREVMPLCSA